MPVKNKNYSEEFRKRVGLAALEDGITLETVGERFDINLTLVRNWKTRYSADEIAPSIVPEMALADAVKNLINDDANLEACQTIVLADWQDADFECDKQNEEMDYLVEQAIETLTDQESFHTTIVDRVAEYWLELESVKGSEPFEIKVRCAEFLATLNRYNDIPNADIQSLACSNIWTDRLVAGWTVRVRDDDFSSSLKGLLLKDPFEDDNGNALIQESIGDYND